MVEKQDGIQACRAKQIAGTNCIVWQARLDHKCVFVTVDSALSSIPETSSIDLLSG